MTNLMKLSKEWHLATALYDAIEDANLRQAASLLLEKHANPNLIIPDYGITPFHLAVGHENEIFSREVTKLLLKNGGDPNVTGIDGVTPLHVAVAWNRSVIVRLLLSYGADPWILDDSEKNSFHHAFEERAWDSLRTLEIFRRTRNLELRVNETKNYSIQLEKVVIHGNDVQAEYKPHFHASCCDASKSKQNVGTQTPLTINKIQKATGVSSDSSYEKIRVDLNRAIDDSSDWCKEAQDLMITDDCKRKIMLHRSRSKIYESSPEKQPVTCVIDESDGSDKPKYFSDSCCCNKRDTNFDNSDSKEESFSTVKEKVPETCDQSEVQTTSNANVSRCDVVHKKKITSPDNISFSEESLFSDDLSDYPSSKDKPVFHEIKTLTLIDESTSISSLTMESVCQKNDDESVKDVPLPIKSEKSTIMKSTRNDLKTGSWSRCLRQCACIPKQINDSDSFSTYQINSKFKSDLPSGIDVLPENSEFETTDLKKQGDSLSGVDVNDGVSTNPLDRNISIELKYTDEEDGIEFIEAKLPLSTSSQPTSKIKCKTLKCSSSDGHVEDSEPSDPGSYDTDYIRKELKKVGFISGPMVGTPIKRLYLKKLRRIRKTVGSPVALLIRSSFSSELEQVLRDDNWLETLSKWSTLEKDVRENFLDWSLSSSWRNGTAKTSFTYLLLDPHISDNLPARCEKMDLIDVWRTFTKAIFYIGKGTRARPYEHLHEAFLVWSETKSYNKRHCSLKVKHILDIWKDDMGVVCLQAFHNLIPAEAYTREAAMIDAISLPRLKNEKCGMYYGVAASWNSKMKRRLGAFLLYRALRIFIAQNEIQLKPTDVK